MKRYLYVLAGLALAATLASCEKDKYGTDAGNDSTPNIVIKAFSAELPNDPDCDVVVRFAANNATTDVYYFAELQSERKNVIFPMRLMRTMWLQTEQNCRWISLISTGHLSPMLL